MAGQSSEYRTGDIRNVAVVGHGSCGKTTLVDAMCYVAGATSRRGSVRQGTALTDHTPEEREHGMSIQLGLARMEWMGTKVNLLDTPGYFDFYGDLHAGMRVADGAVVVVDAAAGVEVGTRKAWRMAEERGIPRLIFVTGMDRDNASFQETFEEITGTLSPSAIPVEVPIGSGADYRGIVNLFSDRAHVYREDSDTGEYDESEVPEELREGASEWETELIETIATTDDSLLESYLEGEELEREQVLEALAAAMAEGELFPVFCGSGLTGGGVRALMKKVVELLPSPDRAGPHEAEEDGELLLLEGTDDEPFSALVFKVTSEPHTGELSVFRIYSGTVSSGESVRNASRGNEERISHLSVPHGDERHEVERLHAGDVGVVAKLGDTHAGDTLSGEGRTIVHPGIDWPEPDIAVAVAPLSVGEEDRLASGLAAIHEEDPTFTASYDSELAQTIARGLGELHLKVCLEKLERKHNVEVETEQPRIAYRETITRQAEGHARHKKQTGGRGQFGECWIRLRPLSRGEGYDFVDSTKGGVIPSKFIPAVDEGIREAAERGVVAGYPVVDFQAEVYDGSHHSVDSSEQAFNAAGSKAFRSVVEEAAPILLEPILEVEVRTPEEYMGDVIGDLNQRRGRVVGMDSEGTWQVVRAQVPEAEMYKYSAALRSITHGQASHSRSFYQYEPVPSQVAERIVEQAGERREAS